MTDHIAYLDYLEDRCLNMGDDFCADCDYRDDCAGECQIEEARWNPYIVNYLMGR